MKLSVEEREKIFKVVSWIPNEMTEGKTKISETTDYITIGRVYGHLLKELNSNKDKNLYYAHKSMVKNKDDILAAGNIGLCKALNSYHVDHETGSSFNTYATKCIRNEMMQENMRIIRATRPDIMISLEGFKEENEGMELPLPKSESEKSVKEFEDSVSDNAEALAKALRDIAIVDKWNNSEKIGLEWIIAHTLYEVSGDDFIKNHDGMSLRLCQEYADKAKKKLNNEIYLKLFKDFVEKGFVLPKNSFSFS